MINIHHISAYQYDLPPELIAQEPHQPVDECKFLVYEDGKIEHHMFKDLSSLINSETIVFFNNSKVIKARVLLDENNHQVIKNGNTSTISHGEIFFLEPAGDHLYHVLVRPGKKLQPGTQVKLGEHTLVIVGMTETGRIVKISHSLENLLDHYGQMPLPPYISYDESKIDWYQPIMARHEGSVAAPTASLHFSPQLIENLKNKGVGFDEVTLHVGIGTFKNIDTEDVTKYQIHRERASVDIQIFDRIAGYKNIGKSILSIGTTSCRTLESLPSLYYALVRDGYVFTEETSDYWNNLIDGNFVDLIGINNDIMEFGTQIYIYPGYSFQIIDELITNFHLPGSSLLVMISALIGYDNIMDIYAEAIQQQYRFFSFGDAMRIRNKKSPPTIRWRS